LPEDLFGDSALSSGCARKPSAPSRYAIVTTTIPRDASLSPEYSGSAVEPLV
jgi:hypothetical protein